MNRSEFTGLPLSLALGIIWDALRATGGHETNRVLDDTEAPKPARPPKYDQIMYRKDGVMWASECDAEGLRFWHKRAAESADSGSQYAEKDAKLAKSLAYWITWREQNPTAIWTGERNRQPTTARAPQGKPEVYPRDARPQPTSPAPTNPGGGYSDADYGADDDIQFALNVTSEAGERWWKP